MLEMDDLDRSLAEYNAEADNEAAKNSETITEKELRNDIMDDVDPDATIFPATVTDTLWIILSEYSWFYNYYKNKYAA